MHEEIKAIDNRMEELISIRKATVDYRRTKAIYAQYHNSGWAKSFLTEHEKEIQMETVTV